MYRVEDIYWNKFKKKVHLVGSYYAKMFRVFALLQATPTARTCQLFQMNKGTAKRMNIFE